MKLLMLGLEKLMVDALSHEFSDAQLSKVESFQQFQDAFETYSDGMFDCILCGSEYPLDTELEVAQIITAQCPATPSLFVTSKSESLRPQLLKKNGFGGTYFYPLDMKLLVERISQFSSDSEKRRFKSVSLDDLSGMPLEFETFMYLPANQKYVRLTKSKQVFDGDRLRKLQDQGITRAHIDLRDIGKFNESLEKRINSSATRNEELITDSVRALFHSLFDGSGSADFEKGRQILEASQRIIATIAADSDGKWWRTLNSMVGHEDDCYVRAITVSNCALLFATGLGYKAPSELALAGLFHDLSLEGSGLENKSLLELTGVDRDSLISHPERSLDILKMKRVILPKSVVDAIAQHHEHFDGTGYPRQIGGHRLSVEAQILSLSDQLEKATRLRPGNGNFSLKSALLSISGNGSINPEFISKIISLVDKKVSWP